MPDWDEWPPPEPPVGALAEPRPERALEYADWFVVDDWLVDCDWPPAVPDPPACVCVALWVVELEFDELAVADESFAWLEEPPPDPELTAPCCREDARESAC